jgi:hypothetical protein
LALWNKDRERFLECYHVPPNGETFLNAEFDALAIVCEFVSTIKRAYGQDGLAYFQDITTAKAGMLTFIIPNVESPWWKSKVIGSIRIDGNEARCYDPVLGLECGMTRTGSAWQINLEVPSSAACTWKIGYCKMMVEVLGKCMPEIGKPGVTIDDIRSKLGKLERAGADRLGPRPRGS